MGQSIKVADGITLRERNGRWQADVVHNGLRSQKSYSSVEEATAKAKATLQDLEKRAVFIANANIPKTGWTVGKAIQELADHVWSQQRSNSDSRGVKVVEFFGANTPLNSITATRAKEFVTALRSEGYEPTTINRFVSALSSCYTHAIKYSDTSGITSRPALSWEDESGSMVERYITEAEEAELIRILTTMGPASGAPNGIAATREPGFFKDQLEFFLWALDSGQRVGALFKVTPRMGDLSGDTGLMILPRNITKTRKAQIIPMTDRIRESWERRAAMLKPDEPFWPPPAALRTSLNRKSANPENYQPHSWYRKAWLFAKHHMGLDDDDEFTPNCLRHTAATRILEATGNIKAAQEILGHSRVKTTERYSHFLTKTAIEAIRAVEAKSKRA